VIAVNPPHPSQWERHLVLSDGRRLFARPIRPDDEPLFLRLLQHVSAEDLRLRFFDSIKEFTHPFLAQLTELDYARAMAFIALDEASGEALGVVRLHSDSIGDAANMQYCSDRISRAMGWVGA
jgi:acetyltransferase